MLHKRFFRSIGLAIISLAIAGVSDVLAQQRELHTVALYESQGGNPVAVEVDRPGQQVTLFLTAYESINWQVSATPGTTIESVILGGYESQSVQGLAAGVDVEYFDRTGESSRTLYVGRELDTPQFRDVIRFLYEKTGIHMTSFQESYRPENASSFVINQTQDNPLLRLTYPQPVHYSELPDLQFQSLYYPTQPAGQEHRFLGPASYGDFTLAGPVLNSLRTIPDNAEHITKNTNRETFYAIKSHDAVELDWENRSTTEMIFPSDIEDLSWPVGLTYDSNRDRLMLASLGGEGFLYQFPFRTEEWSVVSSMNNVDLRGLVYHEADDLLYGLADEYQSTPLLYAYNANGALLDKIELGLPDNFGMIGRGGGKPRLVSVDDYLVLLTEPAFGSPAQTFLISPNTGNVVRVVPEPSTLLLAIAGLGMVACFRFRRRRTI